MEKGLFIMIVIFLLVGLAHFLSHRLEKISTKSKLRKLFWYFYGGYFLFYGIFRNVEDNWNVLGIIFILISLLVLLLNFLGKIETRSNLD